MIIRENEIYDALKFRRGLARAIKGVVRITSESASQVSANLATGWLITDSLVVICDYVLTLSPSGPQPKYFCNLPLTRTGRVPPQIAAEPVADLVRGDTGTRPALLRLQEPVPRAALSLKSNNLELNDVILILHYPMGTPSPKLSLGRIHDNLGWLKYDANTQGGSGGGPILSPLDFAVAGMHVKGSREYNQGLSLYAMLAALQESEVWPEIAHHHKLLDTSRARSMSKPPEPPPPAATDETLLAAAVSWSFDPKSLPEKKRDQLKNLVNDPSAARWTIRATDRQNLIRSAGSLAKLRKIRDKEAKGDEDKGQKVIDRILKGPPYDLHDVDDSELPYWLQAVRWFADIEPSLPTPAEVNRDLERRRIKSRLQRTTGPDFRGREEQLGELKQWYANLSAGPMVVSGIGGVGKSALVARFIQLLPDDPIVLWLDFDRADLAPDDAVSVLTLISQQLSVQLDDFTMSPVTASSWQDSAKEIGTALSRQPPPVLVLDGFEVAQQVKQHNEIWQVLKLILAVAHDMRIIVSGRAPVMDVELDERPAKNIYLKGMAEEDAKSWLRGRGIKDEQVLHEIVEISDGVPLVLLLALRLLDDGVPIPDLPNDLPKALIQGFLYERILDRVLDPVLKPVAQDALVLRSLCEAMIPEVLFDRIPEGLTAADVFSRLSLEMGLVGDQGDPRALSVLLPGKTNVLHVRPELRTATLKLLEKDAPQRVRLIDERAVDWYRRQDLTDVANAAELVYHHLRLGNIQAAEEVWTDSSALLLMYAEDDLPETAEKERAWLRDRISNTEVSDIEGWERDVAERIRSAMSRGLLRVVPDLLREHPERSKNSPLAMYDAWMRWQDNDLAGVRKALGPVGEIAGPADRDRAVMAALLSASTEDRPEADRLLAALEDETFWADRPDSWSEVLAVRAARIRLAVDLKKEIALSQLLRNQSEDQVHDEFRAYITAPDVVLPALSQRLGEGGYFEDASVVVSNVDRMRMRLENEWSRAAKSGASLRPLDQKLSSAGPWRAADLSSFHAEKPTSLESELSQDLVVLSWRRWQLALEGNFLHRAFVGAVTDQQTSLTLASVITLAAFRGLQLYFQADDRSYYSIDHFLTELLMTPRHVLTPHSLSDDRKALVRQVWSESFPEDPPLMPESLDATVRKKFLIKGSLQGTGYRLFVKHTAEKHSVSGDVTNLPDGTVQIVVIGSEGRVDAFKNDLTGSSLARTDQVEELTFVRDSFPMEFVSNVDRPDIVSILLFLLGPDPLEMLCRRVIGLPDSVT